MKEEEDILRYLNLEMDEKERQQFELGIKEDADLKESVLHSKIIKNVLDEDSVQFKSKVHRVITSNRKNQTFRRIWIAASVSILAIASIYYLLIPKTSPTEVAIAYQEPYPDIITSRAEESFVDMSLYNQGNYKQAIPVFESSLKQSDKLLIRLYLGVSYLMIDKNDKAVEVLSSVPFDQTQFQEDFDWYLSLALIKLERHDEAITKLLELERKSYYYKDKSQDLLESLD